MMSLSLVCKGSNRSYTLASASKSFINYVPSVHDVHTTVGIWECCLDIGPPHDRCRAGYAFSNMTARYRFGFSFDKK